MPVANIGLPIEQLRVFSEYLHKVRLRRVPE